MQRQQKQWSVPIFLGLMIGMLVVTGGAQAQVIDEVKHFPSPFLLTAAGQSPDVLMVKIIAEREKLDFTHKALAASADLDGMKTLLLVMGVSMKGLGAAGIKLDEEVTRVTQLIEDARAKNMPIIGMFAAGAGGRGGRDQLTDSLLEQVAPQVDYLVVIKTGDKDEFLKGLAEKHQIPLTYMETVVDMTKVVPAIFQ